MQHDLSKPALEGFGARNAQWVHLPPKIEGELSRALGIQGSYLKLDTPQAGLLGHYQVNTPDGLLFLKVLPHAKAERQIAADRLTREIMTDRYLLSRSLDRSPRSIDGDLSILTYDFIPGEYLPHTDNALSKLGDALGHLHLELGSLENTVHIQRRCNSRWKRLTSYKGTLKRMVAENIADTAVRQSVDLSLDTNVTQALMKSPQVIHGDLNYGNVLLDPHPGGKIAFLDFEEATEAYYSPLFDVAMVIERFILDCHTDKDTMLDAFGSAYQKAGGRWFSDEVSLTDMLKGLAIRAMLVLTASKEAGWPDWKEQEWHKFVALHESAVRNDSDLSRWSKCQL